MEINFNPDGTAECLHSDLIPLQTLGRLEVKRLSRVEFDIRSQEWEVVTKACLFRHPSRAECLSWEQAHWEELL